MGKGVSMPIQAITLLAIAAVVIIVLIMSFVTNVVGGSEDAKVNAWLEQQCARARFVYKCGAALCTSSQSGMYADGILNNKMSDIEYEYENGRTAKLSQICSEKRGTTSVYECCACPLDEKVKCP